MDLEIGGQTATSFSAFEFLEEPFVSAVRPANGPTVGGTTITISGVGFGRTDGSDLSSGMRSDDAGVTVSRRPCTDIKVLDSRTITCKTPAGIGLDREIQVRNAIGKASNAAPVFEYNEPVIQSSSPGHAVLAPPESSATKSIEISGVNLWSGDQRDPPPIVTVAGASCD